MSFEVKKFGNGEGNVTKGVVMMNHPFVCNVWSHANDPFSVPFKDVFMKKHPKETSLKGTEKGTSL